MTAVEARTGRASVNDALIPVRTPQRLVAALLLDYAVVLLCGLVGGFIGLAAGRLFDVDVPTSGMMLASIAAAAVHVYNRVLLVGRRGCSLGQDQAEILILDSATGATVGPARAAVREVLSLPLRAAALAVVVIVLRFVGGVIDGALDGLLMVVAAAGASLLFCLGIWRLASSSAGEATIGFLSIHDRAARTVPVDRGVVGPSEDFGPAGVHERVANAALKTWVPATLFVAYWIGALSWPWPNRDRTWLPPAYEVWQSLTGFWWFERFGSDIVPTLWTIALGIGVTLVLGIAFGVLIGSSRRASATTRPLLDFIRSIPKILLITPIVALAGSGATTSVIVIMSGALWPLLLGAMDGVAGVSPAVHDLARSYRISRRDRYAKMILPAAAPNIFAGLRTSVSIGVILLVVVQSVGEARGIGFHLRAENEAFKFDNMFAAPTMLGALGYLLNVIVTQFEKRILHWFYAKGTDV